MVEATVAKCAKESELATQKISTVPALVNGPNLSWLASAKIQAANETSLILELALVRRNIGKCNGKTSLSLFLSLSLTKIDKKGELQS